jgi:erythromycin esterase-like protein
MTTSRIDGMRRCAYPLTRAAADGALLVERIGEARFVLLGEASRGTPAFDQERAEITKRLMPEKACTAVAVEVDRPDAYHV